MFFIAAASAAAIDDEKKQDKRGVLGVGYPGYGAALAAPALAAPLAYPGSLAHAPVLAAHSPYGNMLLI